MSASAQSIDCFGLPVSTASSNCVNFVNAYYDAVLAYRPFAAWTAAADGALSSDGSCPLAIIAAVDCAFCKGDAARAKQLLHQADALNKAVWSSREQQYITAWAKWVFESDPSSCFDTLLQVVERDPTDLFAVKRGQIMGLIIGDGAKMLKIVEHAAAAMNQNTPPKYLHGMWSFGLEQSERYVEAEQRAREGLSFERALGPDAWLDHSMAHSLYFQGTDRVDDAIEFLERRRHAWSQKELHPFLYTHIWWHLALLRVEKREFVEALKIFDEKLWAEEEASEMRTDPQVHLNALGLLWRLETRGQSASSRSRWASVLQAAAGVTLPSSDGAPGQCQHSDLLLDVQLLRGLCIFAKEDAKPLESFFTAVQAHGASMGSDSRAKPYVALARLVVELFRSDQQESGLAVRHSAARKELEVLKPQWSSLGGSVEQRAVLLEALEGGPIVCGQPEANYDKLFL